MLILLIINILISLNSVTAVENASVSRSEYFIPQNWQQWPVSFDYYYKGEVLGNEKAIIAFPNEPKILLQSYKKVYVAYDNENTLFRLTAYQIPHSDYNVEELFIKWQEKITNVPGTQLLSSENNTLVWAHENQITRLTFIQSSYFIYLLLVKGPGDNEAMAQAFTESFAVTDGFSYD